MQFDRQLLFCMNEPDEQRVYCFRYDNTLDLSVVMSVVIKVHSDLAKFQCVPRYQNGAKIFKDNVFK